MTPTDLLAVDDEPHLTRPYVRLLDCERAEPAVLQEPPPAQRAEPEYHGRHAEPPTDPGVDAECPTDPGLAVAVAEPWPAADHAEQAADRAAGPDNQAEHTADPDRAGADHRADQAGRTPRTRPEPPRTGPEHSRTRSDRTTGAGRRRADRARHRVAGHIRTPTERIADRTDPLATDDTAPTASRRPGRRLLAVSSTVVGLTLGIAVLALGAAEPDGAPAEGAEAAAPNRGRLETAMPPGPSGAATAPAANAAVRATPGTSPPARALSAPAGAAVAAPPSGQSSVTDPPVPQQQPLTDETRTGAITRASGLCLDGAQLRAWTCDSSAGQTWTVGTDGTVRTLDRCLDAASQPALRDCDGTSAQQWRTSTAHNLISAASGLCLGTADADSRAPVRLATCTSTDAQRWTLP